ncbi:MAG: DUF2293 domain-containing protein [Desulfobacter sp.]|nr:DUF2293 domain-containing protein [Desulfobacter sp.]WDP85348.1 MAG: DUF2293 domain-containing protein [Desulfobacter sp.]
MTSKPLKTNHPHLIVFPGKRPQTLLSESGEELRPPKDWAFLPAGDAAVTRQVKTRGPSWKVQVNHGRRKISKGIWASAQDIKESKAMILEKRSTPEYAKQREKTLARKQVQHDAYVKEFYFQVIQFLNFHPKYQAMARDMGEKITLHATPVGSGTVARTQRIPIEKRAQAAVIAWMRHKVTAYESMRIARIKGERRQVRRKLAQASLALLQDYRQGRDTPKDCPLKKALG